MTRWRSIGLACLALAIGGGSAAAQSAPPVQWEGRLDAFTGRAWAIHTGVGVTTPLGTYVRFGVVGGIGAGAGGVSGRTDLIARFTFDPFRERRWAPYGVFGVSGRYGEGSGANLVLLAGAEGPIARGWSPAVEAGFGGGVRIGVILRKAFPRRR